jgi:hypothetical protein
MQNLKSFHRAQALLGTLVFIACAARAGAATPELTMIGPRGAQRGTELDLVFIGQRLENAREVLFYQPGLTATTVENIDAGHVKVHLKVAADATLGEHVMRLRTSTGITELRNFFVGPFPLVFETAEIGAGGGRGQPPKQGLSPEKMPSTFEAPQKVPLNVTVQGVVETEQVDYYQVECKKGQRLTAEVEGVRLGELFDPYVAIVDTSRFELAVSDDTALLRQDPVASCIIPRDGPYIIEVRESAYGGSTNSFYRLHVGTFPRPLAVYPAGGMAGEEITVHYVADVLGSIEQKLKVPERPGQIIGLFAEQDGLSAPSPNWFRVSPFPNVLKVEPNHDVATATPANHDLPVAFNGIIEKNGDVDYFKFKASKGQALDLRVYARQLRSPLDSVMVLYNEKGGAIASNDDSGGPDSYIRFNVPEDGNYLVSIQDQLHRGGPDFVYRIEVTPVAPELKLTIPNNGLQNSQERQTVSIPRGNRFGTQIRATRADFSSELALLARDLPAGVTMTCENFQPGQDVIPVVFEAAPDAPVAGKLCDLTAQAVAAKDDKGPQPDIHGELEQTVELVTYQNNGGLYSTTVDKLAVAVTDEAPFTLQIVQPKVPLTQNGSMDLKIVAQRKPGFTGAINLHMLWEPPGVNAGNVTMPGDQNEFLMPISAQAGASAHRWKIAVLGQADVNGQLWVSSPLAELDVEPAFMGIKIHRSAVEQGQQVLVPCDIEQKTPYEGKAKVELLGLPNGATAPDAQVGAEDKQVVFNVQTDAKTPAATHTTLLCKFTLMRDGEPIIETLGQGGVMRVDAPPPPKPGDKPAGPKPATPSSQPSKPLSRLEQLRQEQQQQPK